MPIKNDSNILRPVSWKMNLSTESPDTLNNDISVFVGNYQNIQNITFFRLRDIVDQRV